MCERLDRDVLHSFDNDAGVRLSRGEVRDRQGRVGTVQELPGAVEPDVFEHLVAKVTQADFSVSFAVLSGKLRQHIGDPVVRVVVALEGEQVHYQRAPLSLGDSNGEQEHYLEVGDAGGDDAETREEGVHQRGRHAGLFNFTVVAAFRARGCSP